MAAARRLWRGGGKRRLARRRCVGTAVHACGTASFLCRRQHPRGHCQRKFYTACSRTTAGWSSTVFPHKLSPRSAEFDAEKRLYLFALTVPSQRTKPREAIVPKVAAAVCGHLNTAQTRGSGRSAGSNRPGKRRVSQDRRRRRILP
jgi:hypothetical protein